MNIQSIPVSLIRPAAYNPRTDLQPGDPAYEHLKQSIAEFGFVEPLVWNQRTGNLVGGHQRFKVLEAEGAAHVEVSVVDLPPNKEKALNIALNKIQGGWDERKLAEVLGELMSLPKFDVAVTGFEVPEIEELLARTSGLWPGEKEEAFDVEEALGEVDEPVTQTGDLISLGRHRLLCGDAAQASDIQRLVGEREVDLVFTDPPYNVNYYGGSRPKPKDSRPKRSRQWRQIYADDLSQEQYEDWLGRVLSHVGPVLGPGAPFYIWNGHRQFGPMHRLLEDLGFKVSCVITWVKENFAIGYGDYNQQTEFCLYGWKDGNGAHRWYGPTNESTVWQVRRDPTRSYEHPTQKPLELAERAIRNSSKPDDMVLDTFLGSGSTLIAAERTGRTCCGLEIDPRYCDVIVKRYLAFAGREKNPELSQRYPIEGAVYDA